MAILSWRGADSTLSIEDNADSYQVKRTASQEVLGFVVSLLTLIERHIGAIMISSINLIRTKELVFTQLFEPVSQPS